jgi:hypothetical protein
VGALEIGERQEYDEDDTGTATAASLLFSSFTKEPARLAPFCSFLPFHSIPCFYFLFFSPPCIMLTRKRANRRGWTALFLVERRMVVLEQSIQSERTGEVYSPLRMGEREREKKGHGET